MWDVGGLHLTSAKRLIAVAFLTFLIVEGVWCRSPVAPRWQSADFQVSRIVSRAVLPATEGDMHLLGVWQLSSRARSFGGYSSLLALPDGRFWAFSDFGWRLAFSQPSRSSGAPDLQKVPGDPKLIKKWQHDIESSTRDPQTGDLWLGYEGMNMIRRHSATSNEWAAAFPPEMEHWPKNSGPESLQRLADGRFLVLSEGGTGTRPGPSEGLLFDKDPVAGGVPTRFRLIPPKGYRPTDLALLPDGRVLILLRKLDLPLPPFFRSRLLIADPATIREGENWSWQTLLDFAPPIPAENYEGMDIRDLGGGAVDIWIIADDNQAALERTLLLKLRWNIALQNNSSRAKDQAHEKARGTFPTP
ncbi:esterase-like activity of phytase family protein [Altericroceibacterium spongiae]|uniref:Esterase-like activity of phytase family protein n=1 Tax=Altericroceibacterium spongiae TaxID=2320269 RepID=A0A420ENX5_9SPHN|nr:esterase-like activity of phytase family protein [Altericroceibacterium spongiae]RKF22324.1 esterase-like activity of phytase family protein [Altericroceibacterium spongiae]